MNQTPAPGSPPPFQPVQGQPPQGWSPQAPAPGGTAPQGQPAQGQPCPPWTQPQWAPQSAWPPQGNWAAPAQGWTGYPPAYALGQGWAVPRKDPRVKGASQTLNRLCLCVLAQTVFSLFWSFCASLFLGMLGADLLGDDLGYLLLTAALVPLSTALPFVVYLAVGRRDLGEYLRFEKVGFLPGLLFVLAGLAICLLGNYPAFFLQDLLGAVGYQPASGGVETSLSWSSFWVDLLSTAVLVPVMEELVFRGVVFSGLRKFGTGFAVIGSALVFGVVHMDVTNVLFALVAGLVFGWLYARTGNLWVTVAIHGLNNGLAVVGAYLGLFVPQSAAGLVNQLLLAVPIALGILALGLLFLFYREKLLAPLAQLTPCPLEAAAGGKALARTPLFWAIVLVMVWYTVSLFI